MTPDSLFQIAGPIAMIGWAALALAPLAPKWADRIGGLAIPAILSVGYAAVILGYWWQGQGGFDSLANVMLLLSNPWMALAGWGWILDLERAKLALGNQNWECKNFVE